MSGLFQRSISLVNCIYGLFKAKVQNGDIFLGYHGAKEGCQVYR